jgi:hypothetical protein
MRLSPNQSTFQVRLAVPEGVYTGHVLPFYGDWVIKLRHNGRRIRGPVHSEVMYQDMNKAIVQLLERIADHRTNIGLNQPEDKQP